MKRIVSSFVLLLLALTLFSGLQFVGSVSANFFPIPIPQPAFTIKWDGSVSPSTAPIQRDEDVYTFTDDIVGYTIVVERNNIVLDGGGFILKGNGNSTGVFIKNRAGVTVRNMEVSNFSYGIKLVAEDYVGYTSSNNSFSGNTLTNNKYGIHISSSHKNVFRNNRMNNNQYNFGIRGGYLSDRKFGYKNDIDTSNTVDGKPIIYWVNQQDRTVPSGVGYVALVSCMNITVPNLNLANNKDGILLVSTTDSIVTKNNITKMGIGIYSYLSSNNTISGNNINNNTNTGIELLASNNNSISENYIANNPVGILIADSSKNEIIKNLITENSNWGMQFTGDQKNNIIYHNSFINNNAKGEGLQVSINSEHHNAWDNGPSGNYWSDYLTRYPEASEGYSSGRGDTEFYINSGNIDHHPLMEPRIIPEFPSWASMLFPLITLAAVLSIYKWRLTKKLTR